MRQQAKDDFRTQTTHLSTAHDCQSKQWWSEEDKTTHNVTTLRQQLLYDDKHEGEVRMLACLFLL